VFVRVRVYICRYVCLCVNSFERPQVFSCQAGSLCKCVRSYSPSTPPKMYHKQHTLNFHLSLCHTLNTYPYGTAKKKTDMLQAATDKAAAERETKKKQAATAEIRRKWGVLLLVGAVLVVFVWIIYPTSIYPTSAPSLPNIEKNEEIATASVDVDEAAQTTSRGTVCPESVGSLVSQPVIGVLADSKDAEEVFTIQPESMKPQDKTTQDKTTKPTMTTKQIQDQLRSLNVPESNIKNCLEKRDLQLLLHETNEQINNKEGEDAVTQEGHTKPHFALRKSGENCKHEMEEKNTTQPQKTSDSDDDAYGPVSVVVACVCGVFAVTVLTFAGRFLNNVCTPSEGKKSVYKNKPNKATVVVKTQPTPTASPSVSASNAEANLSQASTAIAKRAKGNEYVPVMTGSTARRELNFTDPAATSSELRKSSRTSNPPKKFKDTNFVRSGRERNPSE